MTYFIQWFATDVGWYDVKEITKEQYDTRKMAPASLGERVIARGI